METQLKITVDGQSVALEDLNTLGEAGALADDRVFQTLFPLGNPLIGGKAIIPLGSRVQPGHTLVHPRPDAVSALLVAPFRAYIGATDASGTEGAQSGARSAIFAGTSTVDDTLQELAIDPTVSNNRVDLVYARLARDVAAPAVLRAVKAADESVSSASVSTSVKCAVTIGVVKGIEASTPALPSEPSYSAGVYYVPLAYVRLVHPHTAITQITRKRVLEVAPIVPISRRVGAVSCQPATAQWKPGGAIMASPTGGIGAAGIWRPASFLPSTFQGRDERTIALSFQGATTGRSLALGEYHVLDASRDWRGCIFRSDWYFRSGAGGFAWDAGEHPQAHAGVEPVTPQDGVSSATIWGNSMAPSFLFQFELGVGNLGGVAKLAPGNLSEMAASSHLHFYVDMTTGYLMLKIGVIDPDGYLFGIVSAIGPHGNLDS
jgi:hypothetical protein